VATGVPKDGLSPLAGSKAARRSALSVIRHPADDFVLVGQSGELRLQRRLGLRRCGPELLADGVQSRRRRSAPARRRPVVCGCGSRGTFRPRAATRVRHPAAACTASKSRQQVADDDQRVVVPGDAKGARGVPQDVDLRGPVYLHPHGRRRGRHAPANQYVAIWGAPVRPQERWVTGGTTWVAADPTKAPYGRAGLGNDRGNLELILRNRTSEAPCYGYGLTS
jgi:hypothetical protein